VLALGALFAYALAFDLTGLTGLLAVRKKK